MEIRKLEDNTLNLEGYINVTERNSEVLTDNKGSKFIEQTKKGIFTRALKKNKPVALLNHDWSKQIGIYGDNLSLVEDSIGLKYSLNVRDKDAIEYIDNHGVNGCSFGFSVNKDSRTEGKDGVELRTLEDINLYEISILSGKKPAYSGSSVYIRELDGESKEIEFREMSYDDIEMKLLSLIQEPLIEDEKYDVQVKKVYEDYFIYKNYKENKYYKQGYNVQDENVSLIGIKEEVFELYLTQEEVNKLNKTEDVEIKEEVDDSEISLLEQEIEIMKLKGDVEQ